MIKRSRNILRNPYYHFNCDKLRQEGKKLNISIIINMLYVISLPFVFVLVKQKLTSDIILDRAHSPKSSNPFYSDTLYILLRRLNTPRVSFSACLRHLLYR
jgi:hypothetical protein